MVVAVSLGVGSLALATGRGAEAFDGAILLQSDPARSDPARSECPENGQFDATILQEFKYLCEAFYYLSEYSHEYSAGDLASLGSAAADAVEEGFDDGRLSAHGTNSRPHKCVLPFPGFADACTQIERAVADDTVDAILLAGDAMMKEHSLHRLLTPAQRDTWRQGQKGDRPQWFGLEVLPLDADDDECWPLSAQCQLKITHVHPGSPASIRGLSADQVVEEWSVVGDPSLSDLGKCQVYGLGLPGRYTSGTEVAVQVSQWPGIDIRLRAATVPWAWSQMVDDAGYLRMEWTPFLDDPHSSGSINVFRDALSGLAGASAVVLDLRDTNQRGILKRHLDAIGYFLPADSALLTRSHTKEIVPYGGGTPEDEHIPMLSTVTPVDTTTPVRVVVSPVPTDRTGRFDMIPAVLQHAERADIVGTGTVGTPIRVNDKLVVEQYIPIGEGRGWRMYYAREEWRLPNDTDPPAYTLDHNIDLPTCASLNDITAAALGGTTPPPPPPTTTTTPPPPPPTTTTTPPPPPPTTTTTPPPPPPTTTTTPPPPPPTTTTTPPPPPPTTTTTPPPPPPTTTTTPPPPPPTTTTSSPSSPHYYYNSSPSSPHYYYNSSPSSPHYYYNSSPSSPHYYYNSSPSSPHYYYNSSPSSPHYYYNSSPSSPHYYYNSSPSSPHYYYNSSPSSPHYYYNSSPSSPHYYYNSSPSSPSYYYDSSSHWYAVRLFC